MEEMPGESGERIEQVKRTNEKNKHNSYKPSSTSSRMDELSIYLQRRNYICYASMLETFRDFDR